MKKEEIRWDHTAPTLPQKLGIPVARAIKIRAYAMTYGPASLVPNVTQILEYLMCNVKMNQAEFIIACYLASQEYPLNRQQTTNL